MDSYRITINGTAVNVPVAKVGATDTYAEILQAYVTPITAITGITATYDAARTTLLVESVAGNTFTFLLFY